MFKVQVVAILDKAKSKNNIQQSLSQISSSLSNSSINTLKIVGTLNKNETLKNLNNELSKITSVIKLKVDNTSLSNSIKLAQSKITQFSTNNTVPIGTYKKNNNQYKDILAYKNTLSYAKKQFANLGEVSANWVKNAQGQIQGFTVSVKKANGEVEKFNYSLRQTEQGKRFFTFTGSIGNDSGILKLQKDIEATKSKAKELLSALNNTSRGTVSNTQTYKDLLNLTNTMKNPSDIDKFNNKFKELKALVNDIYSRSRTGSSLNPIQGLQDKLSKADILIRNLQTSFSKLQTHSAINNNSVFQTELSTIQGKISTIVAEYNKLKNVNFSNITNSDKLLQTVDRTRAFINNLQQVNSQVKTLDREASAYNAKLNTTTQSQNLVFGKKQLSNQILVWMNNNTKAAKIYGEQLNQLRTKINSVTDTRGLTSIRKEFASIKSEAGANDLLGNTFFTTLMNDVKKFSTWFGVGGTVAMVVRNIREMFTNVTELNTSMIELKKVTDETDSTYQTFLENSTAKAKKLGVTITDLIDATSSFARLGYSLDDSAQLGEIATMYANVGDEIESVDDAASSIISTVKAFDIDAEDSMSIIDKINEVSNSESISAGGLGEALQRSAAALATANNDLNESLALITAGNLVNQDPISVGTGLKTAALRIRGAKAELEEMGEDTEGMIESTSKLQFKIKALTGVDILEKDGNTFKSTYRILKEISEIWNSLTDLDRANILEDLFGKRQANIGASILGNFDIAEKSLKEALNSKGSAQKEYEKWLDSVEAKQAQYQASFEALSNSIISSDFMIDSIETGTQILDLITGINEGLGIMPVLLAAISSVWLTKNNMGKPDTMNCVRWLNVNMPIAV